MKQYEIGDTITIGYCGPDMSSSASGDVVYVDKEHVLVRIQCCDKTVAESLNRRGILNLHKSYPGWWSSDLFKEIETSRINEHDVFLDMKYPASYLPKDILEKGDSWAPVLAENIFWDNLVLDEPVNGYTVVEKDGKYNFINSKTDEYFSDIWFERVLNWTRGRVGKNTVVQHEGICYKINDNGDWVTAVKLKPSQRRKPDGWRRFELVFGSKARLLTDFIHRTVCKIDDRWYITSCLRNPWNEEWNPIYFKKDRDETVNIDAQWWYFIHTTFACAELRICKAKGKFGLFPLREDLGIVYYAEGYPFIYDEIKAYNSHTVEPYVPHEDAFGYIAVKEEGKWGLLKLTGEPTMKLERIAESIYSDPDNMFNELGIQLPENAQNADLRGEDGAKDNI